MGKGVVEKNRQTDGKSPRDSMGSLGPGQTHVGFDVCLFTESHDTMIYCLSRKSPISWGESWLLHPAGAGHTLNYEALGVEMVNHTGEWAWGRTCWWIGQGVGGGVGHTGEWGMREGPQVMDRAKRGRVGNKMGLSPSGGIRVLVMGRLCQSPGGQG